jgi:hypothetical protein
MNKTAKKHFVAVQSGQVTKTNIIGFRKLLNSLSRSGRGGSTGCTAPKASWQDADNILSEIHKRKPIVTGALHDSGLKMLQSKRYRKRLESVAAVISNLAEFRLVNFEEFGTSSGELHYPIYRAIANDGASFDFVNIPWQSGGNGPTLVENY